jgi:glycosyltransferase involved in cell wall biosynthesis
VIPCWNAERWIGRAIQSVLDQNYANVEIIIIDDGSTDGSLEVIKAFGEKVHWETGPNRGGCAARNQGARLATSQYILFVDADDYLEGAYLKGLGLTAAKTDADLIIGRLRHEVNERDEKVDHFAGDYVGALRGLFHGGWIQTGQVLWKASFLIGIGLWDEDIRKNQDLEIAFRALASRPSFVVSESGRYVYNEHESKLRISNSNIALPAKELLAVFDKLTPSILETNEAEIISLLALRYYGLARAAYRFNLEEIGQVALERSRQLGMRGHRGSFMHRSVATLLGLRGKEKVATFVRRWRNRAAVEQ